MCIIVAKPAGVAMPTWKTLKTCFENNPHGAGFMFPKDGSVHIVKGLMTFKEFKGELSDAIKSFDPVKTPVVMHFRIATTGSTSMGNCHPFPICRKYATMKRATQQCTAAMAHNGVIKHTSKDPDCVGFDVSDTMVFVKKYVDPLFRIRGGHLKALLDDEILDVLENLADSKLAFLDANGVLRMRGHFTQDHGVYYSNYTYSANRSKSNYGGYYGRYYDNMYDYSNYGGYTSYTGKNGTSYGSYSSSGYSNSLPSYNSDSAKPLSSGTQKNEEKIEKSSKPNLKVLDDSPIMEEQAAILEDDADEAGLTSLRFHGEAVMLDGSMETIFPYCNAIDENYNLWEWADRCWFKVGPISRVIFRNGASVAPDRLFEASNAALPSGAKTEHSDDQKEDVVNV